MIFFVCAVPLLGKGFPTHFPCLSLASEFQLSSIIKTYNKNLKKTKTVKKYVYFKALFQTLYDKR